MISDHGLLGDSKGLDGIKFTPCNQELESAGDLALEAAGKGASSLEAAGKGADQKLVETEKVVDQKLV